MINITEEFIFELNIIIKMKRTEDVLDYIFDVIGVLLCSNDRPDLVNDILKNLDVEKYDSVHLLCFLTATFANQEILDYYDTFHEK